MENYIGVIRCYLNKENKIINEEFLYIHLQKRKMKIDENISDYFVIVPNEFIAFNPKMLNSNNIKKFNHWKPLYSYLYFSKYMLNRLKQKVAVK